MSNYKIISCTKSGRYGISTKNIKRGEIIDSFESFASVSYYNVSCFWCLNDIISYNECLNGQKPIQLMFCSGCKSVSYCSRTCQLKDWKKHHFLECSQYKKIYNRQKKFVLTPSLMLATRILNKSLSCKKDYSLVNFIEKRSPERIQTFIEMAQLVKEMVSPQVVEKTPDILKSIVILFCELECNGFTIPNEELVPIGIGYFPDAALFNHSCDSNSYPYFTQQKLELRAIKNIQKDEEITVSYINICHTLSWRQKMLKESYFFECKCTRCITEKYNMFKINIMPEDDNGDCKMFNNEADELYNISLTISGQKNTSDVLSILMKSKKLQEECYTNQHIQNIKMNEIIGNYMLEKGDLNEALIYYREALNNIDPKTEIIYSTWYGLMLFKIWNLVLYNNSINKSEEKIFLKKALETLLITHGEKSKICRMLLNHIR